MRHLPKLLFALLLSSLPLQAQFGDDEAVKSKASLIVDHEAIAPGSTFTAALHLYHPEGWHSYYRNSGGIEESPSISWTLPEGFQAGPIQWPVPKIKDGEYGTSFIYEVSVTLLVDITAPADLQPGTTANIAAKARWQICETGCINEEAEFSLQVPVAQEPAADSASEELFKEARAKLPVAQPSWTYTFSEQSESLQLTINGEELEIVPTDFIPDQPYWNAASKGGSIKRDGDTILITLTRQTENAFDEPIEQGDSISGILVAETQSFLLPLIDISGKDTQEAKAANKTQAVSFTTLLKILGGMFLGGLILNLMPCVFPVIGLKIMGFVQQAGEHRSRVMLHGIIFTAGVLVSFAVLSGTLFALRETFGWGDQLGEPWFAMAMMMLMFLLGMNMFGVFEIGAKATSVGGKLQSKSGLSGSFFSGALATLIATPCAAPFLGSAIGATIALPAVPFFLSFTSMAIGLSAPYLVLSAFPKLVEALPRPGAWMESFKQAMSFLLFATAGFFLWFYADQIDMNSMTFPWPIFGLCLVGVAAWIYGRWTLPHRKRQTRIIAMVLTIAFAAVGVQMAKPTAEPAAGDQTLSLTWDEWSSDKVTALLDGGTPVYIDFTAKWCLTCQVNKKRAYTQEVIKKMQELGVATLKADKTRNNPEINQAIQSYGRAAIPVNVLLIPGKEPIILPELLSPGDVLEALKKIEYK